MKGVSKSVQVLFTGIEANIGTDFDKSEIASTVVGVEQRIRGRVLALFRLSLRLRLVEFL